MLFCLCVSVFACLVTVRVGVVIDLLRAVVWSVFDVLCDVGWLVFFYVDVSVFV